MKARYGHGLECRVSSHCGGLRLCKDSSAEPDVAAVGDVTVEEGGGRNNFNVGVVDGGRKTCGC